MGESPVIVVAPKPGVVSTALLWELDEFLEISTAALEGLRAAAINSQRADVVCVVIPALQAMDRLRNDMEVLWSTSSPASHE